MKLQSALIYCITTAIAFGDWYYSDATSEIGVSGAPYPHLDIKGVHVEHTSTKLVFRIDLKGSPMATTWGKYMVGIHTGPGGSTTGNPWNRPISMAQGMNYWIGGWVDSGNGAQLWAHNSGWSVHSRFNDPGAPLAPNPANLELTKSEGSVTVSVDLAALGLDPGETLFFDVYTSGGGGTDGAVDALSNRVRTISAWNASYQTYSIRSLGYTIGDNDVDDDGLPDWWELRYFGNISSQSGGNDPDEDIFNNLYEYHGGTHPLLPDSPAYTTPVGYVTLTSYAGEFNLHGCQLPLATFAAGVFDNVGSSSLFDPDMDFEELLDAGEKYLLEITSGLSEGEVLQITAFAMNTLIVSKPLPADVNVMYRVRRIPRLSEIIDPCEPLATDSLNPDLADLVILPDGNGGFSKYFVSTHYDPVDPEQCNQFFNVATGQPEDPHMFYPDGFIYLRRGTTDLLHVLTGEVKMGSNTRLSVDQTFNYFSSVYPVGLTLGNSGLAASLQAGTAETADVVWMQDEFGTWRKYFHSNGTAPLSAGWREVGAPAGQENADQADVPLASGFAIHRRAPEPYRVLLTPPEFYFEPAP